MSTIATITAAVELTNLTMDFVRNLSAGSALIAKAQAEGREISLEEWNAATGLDDAARVRLQAAIDAKQTPEQPPAVV